MKWLSNIYNPNLPDARFHLGRSLHQTIEDVWKWHKYWLQDKIIGEPEASEYYTVQEMKDMNLVGVYAKDDK